MNLQETIRKVLSEHNKGKDKKIRDIILNATEWDDFLSALAVKYGDTVPLYHATTKETAEIIDREGFKLTYGKNYKSFTPEELIYFQIGHSDYKASNRPVVYRVDVPIDFIAEFADIDMDNVDISDEDLADVGVDMEYFEDMSYEIKDAIRYYVWNNMTLDGMELLITDRNGVGNIFQGLRPVKIETFSEQYKKSFVDNTNVIIPHSTEYKVKETPKPKDPNEEVLKDVDPRLRQIFYNIQRDYGSPLKVKWGKRSAKQNSEAGGVDNSTHLVGLAIDIELDKSCRPCIKKLIELASKYGIMGIGVYKDADTIHLDLQRGNKRPNGTRVWSNDNTQPPAWAYPEIGNHKKR